MRKIIVLVMTLLLFGCSVSKSTKYLNDAGHNMVNAANGGEFAVYKDSVYYFSTEYNQLVKKEIATNEVETTDNFDTGIKDLNFIGDDLLYLVPYMEATFVNRFSGITYSAPIYEIGCYNVLGKECSIDLSELNKYFVAQTVNYEKSGLINSSGQASHYHNVSDIHVSDTYIIFNENMVFKDNVRVTVKDNTYVGGQVFFNYKTNEITKLDLTKIDESQNKSVSFISNYKLWEDENEGLVYLVNSPGSPSWLGFEIYDSEITGENFPILFTNSMSTYGNLVVISRGEYPGDEPGTFILDSEKDEIFRKISNIRSYGFQFYNDYIFINASDGLYSYNDKENKLEKLIDLSESSSSCSLYKFNEILYCGYPDYKVYEFDLAKWKEVADLE